MFNLTISTMIDAPIEQVFDYMCTPENDFRWQYGTLATARITNLHNKVGVYFRSIGHLLERRNLGTYQVIESILNRKYRFKSLSGPLHLHTIYTFDSADDGTKVTISIRVGVVNFFRMNERILERRMKKQLRENLTVLKSLLEMKQFSHQTRNAGAMNT